VLVAPVDLKVAERPGGCGVLEATALTLKSGATGIELYAALRNAGGSLACSAAFSVELFDSSEQSVAAGVGGLLMKRFYRLGDGSGGKAACLAPGDVTLIALRDLSPDVTPEQVSRVEYWCNFWALDVVPFGELEVSEVASVASSEGATFTGVLINGLDEPLPAPAVAVFPLTQDGRPLGVALAEDSEALPPGGRWSFETNAVSERGATVAAFPTRGP
jgi:hypothetical protein